MECTTNRASARTSDSFFVLHFCSLFPLTIFLTAPISYGDYLSFGFSVNPSKERQIWKIYLFSTGFKIPETPACQMQLGMQNGRLPDSVLTASSMLSATYAPGMARLHQTAASGRGGSWIAKTQDHNQWFQIDFGVETTITRIDTQGRQDGSQWVKEYTLRYSDDGSYFTQYQPEGHTKVCCSHRGIVKKKFIISSLIFVANSLPSYSVMRTVKWNNKYCMLRPQNVLRAKLVKIQVFISRIDEKVSILWM